MQIYTTQTNNTQCTEHRKQRNWPNLLKEKVEFGKKKKKKAEIPITSHFTEDNSSFS